MRKLLTQLIFLTLSFGLTAFANSYRDEDTGLVLEIPNELRRTWEIKQYQMGFDLVIFNSDEWKDYIKVVGISKSISPANLEQGVEQVMGQFLGQFEEAFGPDFSQLVNLKVTLLDSIAPAQYPSGRFRVSLNEEEEGEENESITLDCHFFFEKGYVTMIATGGANFEDVDVFTASILEKLRFIEE